MQSGDRQAHAPERVLVIMAIKDGAEQLAAALRELGSNACEIAQDQDMAVRRCAVLQPQLVVLDAHGPDSLQLAAAVRSRSEAAFVYVCDADFQPPPELAALCSSCLERPITRARLQRCLSGLAQLGAAERAHSERSASFCNELLESVARELRAPLQGVYGFAQYLLDGKAGPLAEEQSTCLEQVELGTQHVLQILEDALASIDRDVDTQHVRNDVVDTEQVVHDVLQLLQPLALARDIRLETQVDERLSQVTSDMTKLKQVLFNLIANALQHAADGGKLSVNLIRTHADSFCMEVRDSGAGLTQPMLAHINAENVAPANSGHGLALTRRIVAALGGQLQAFNEEPSGAVFRVQLPVSPAAARPYLRST